MPPKPASAGATEAAKVSSVTATPATHGTVALENGQVTYTPDAGYVGPISFDYLVCDDVALIGPTEDACSSRTVQMAVTDDGAVINEVQPSPIDPTLPTSLYASTAFLYTGSEPLQRDVAPGTIDRRRAAVVRGTVRDGDGQPLSDVRIAVKDHPEFGYTSSRTSGTFDLAVNGGGQLIVTYERDGWSRAHRHVEVPWGDYTWAPDVVLTPADGALSSADPATQLIQSRGPAAVPDDARNDRPVVLVQPGTAAHRPLPDGATQRLRNLSLRTIDYGRDAGGIDSLPALPTADGSPAYALDIWAEEAPRAGASDVTLSHPAAYYVEDALGRKAGEALPLRSYDWRQGAWVPDQGTGLVLAVVGARDGLMLIDADGDGDSDAKDARVLADAGVPDVERQQLYSLYRPGATLWRLPLTRLGTWAWWADPATPASEPGRARLAPAAASGHQAAPERREVTGTPLSLRATPTSAAERTLSVPVTGPQVPPGLQSIEVAVSVAGSRHVARLDPAPDQTYEFEWNGLDGYGRAVQGTFPARVEVTYVTPPTRHTTSAGAVSLKRLDAAGQGLGGWTLDVHQVLDLDADRLYGGDGSERTLRSDQLQREMAEAAGGPIEDIAAGPDGSLYLAEDNQVRRIGPDGRASVVAGSGQWGLDGDGGLATEASFRGTQAVAVGPDGTFYLLDRWNGLVRRVGTDGVISTVAGGGGDGAPSAGPGTTASLVDPRDVAVGADGSVYVADGRGRVLRLGTDGWLDTVAVFGDARALAAAADGTVLVGDATSAQVVRVALDGTVTPVAGPTGLTALAAIETSADGTIFVLDGDQVRRLDPSGTMATVTGATAGDMHPLRGLAVTPDGVVHVATAQGLLVWGASQQTRGGPEEVRVPSPSGTEVFAFDPAGRHLRTVDAGTGAVKYEFSYDQGGRLTEVVVPGLGPVRVERGPNGAAVALVSPDGNRTDMGLTRLLATDPVLGMPAAVLKAYRDAAATARARFACDMRWPVLAAIGKSESGHATSGGARVNAAGQVSPPIVGIPLDGRIGTERITDTDGGRFDGDTVFDRAVGPMQFIPSTWRSAGADGNGDGVADPHNIFDASLAAARYLCNAAPPGNFAQRDTLAKAVFSYNHSSAYVAKVLADVDFYDSYDGARAGTGLTGAYALPIDRSFVDRYPTLLDQPHHDYPAIDLPVPVGSRVYAVASGRVVSVTSGGRCGHGLVIDGNDGYRYTYCHASSVARTVGSAVAAGQVIMLSGNTGNSSGPHLHLQIARADGTLLCPQPLVRAWYRGQGLTPASAPTSGCTS